MENIPNVLTRGGGEEYTHYFYNERSNRKVVAR